MSTPRRTTSPARAGLVTLAALVGLTACTDDPAPAPEAESTPTPSVSSGAPLPPPAPEQGACYRLTAEQLRQPTSAAEPVACTGPHTSRTLVVGQLGDLRGTEDLAATDPALTDVVSAACDEQTTEALGGGPVEQNLSRFVPVFFLPTAEELDAGAAWFRCDVVALGRGEQLLRLPSDVALRGVLDDPAALDTFGTCAPSAPGSPGFERVACALPHSWRALTTLRISDAARYPGEARARAAGDDACADLVEEQAGFTTEIQYGWEWPTAEQWADGQRFGYCWAPA